MNDILTARDILENFGKIRFVQRVSRSTVRIVFSDESSRVALYANWLEAITVIDDEAMITGAIAAL